MYQKLIAPYKYRLFLPWIIGPWWPKAYLWYLPDNRTPLFPSHLCALTNVVRVTHPIDTGEPCRRTHHWRRTSWCHGMQCIGEKRGQCAHNRPKVASLFFGNYTLFYVFFRPVKLATGQADGIQPRTIEILEVLIDYSTAKSKLKSYHRAMDWHNDCCKKEIVCIWL